MDRKVRRETESKDGFHPAVRGIHLTSTKHLQSLFLGSAGGFPIPVCSRQLQHWCPKSCRFPLFTIWGSSDRDCGLLNLVNHRWAILANASGRQIHRQVPSNFKNFQWDTWFDAWALLCSMLRSCHATYKKKPANASSHTCESHVAESEQNSQKRNGSFLMGGPWKVHCGRNSALSCSWEPTWAFAVAYWGDTGGLSAEGGKLISQCFFNMSRNAKDLHSGEKSPTPKYPRWDAPFKAAPVPCLSSKDAPSRRTTLCIFFFLWSTSMDVLHNNRWI